MQKTAYELRISDLSSDVCSSDLITERHAAGKALAIKLLAARDLYLRLDRQRVDDADPDAVKATGGRISLAVELAARMEHGHDDFQRRLAGEFGVQIGRASCRARVCQYV